MRSNKQIFNIKNLSFQGPQARCGILKIRLLQATDRTRHLVNRKTLRLSDITQEYLRWNFGHPITGMLNRHLVSPAQASIDRANLRKFITEVTPPEVFKIIKEIFKIEPAAILFKVGKRFPNVILVKVNQIRGTGKFKNSVLFAQIFFQLESPRIKTQVKI